MPSLSHFFPHLPVNRPRLFVTSIGFSLFPHKPFFSLFFDRRSEDKVSLLVLNRLFRPILSLHSFFSNESIRTLRTPPFLHPFTPSYSVRPINILIPFFPLLPRLLSARPPLPSPKLPSFFLSPMRIFLLLTPFPHNDIISFFFS